MPPASIAAINLECTDDTGRANNGGTEAINGLIELHRRIARGFRNRGNYHLRVLLVGGGLDTARPT